MTDRKGGGGGKRKKSDGPDGRGQGKEKTRKGEGKKRSGRPELKCGKGRWRTGKAGSDWLSLVRDIRHEKPLGMGAIRTLHRQVVPGNFSLTTASRPTDTPSRVRNPRPAPTSRAFTLPRPFLAIPWPLACPFYASPDHSRHCPGRSRAISRAPLLPPTLTLPRPPLLQRFGHSSGQARTHPPPLARPLLPRPPVRVGAYA